MSQTKDDKDPGDDTEVRGVSAGWVVGLVITLTLGLGAAFFIVANSQPVELVDRADAADRDATDNTSRPGDAAVDAR
jgi:hypothetical protein